MPGNFTKKPLDPSKLAKVGQDGRPQELTSIGGQSKNSANDAGSVAGPSSVASNSTPMSQNYGLGNPQVYQSAGSAGSGFINLSHLLGLNKESGARSANSLSDKMYEKGGAARSGISGLEDEFNQKAREGGTWLQDYPAGTHDPASGRNIDREGYDKASKGYTGPNDMGSMSGYADLAKKVGEASGMGQNLESGGFGIAAETQKESGLSPYQSAASAFYMGVNNPNLKRAGGMFANLQKTLDEANARSIETASLARRATDESRDVLGKRADENDIFTADYNRAAAEWLRSQEIAQGKRREEMQGIDAQNEAAREKAQADNHRNPGENSVNSLSDMEWAIKMGMPADLAYRGVTYEQWEAAGRPSQEEWDRMYGG